MTPLLRIPLHKKYISIIFFFTIFFLIIIFSLFGKLSIISSIFFLIVEFIIFIYFDKKLNSVIQKYRVEIENIQEEINLIEEELKKKNTTLKYLPEKAKRILSAKNTIERLINFIDPEQLCENIVKETTQLFPNSENILLFLFSHDRDSLDLMYSFRKNNEIIREKKGDIIDWWVLKNNQSLLINDITSDYRFDVNFLYAYRERKMRSLLVSPFSIGSKLYGILRVESRKPNVFYLEDSRVLRIICDLGAVILERAYLFRKIEELAIKDSLTGLFLRNYFSERFNEEIKRASLKRTKFGIVILDVDDFKSINDTYGHTIGDLVLKKISTILQKNIGNSGNIAARIGGEEFVFLIVESDKRKVKSIAEKIRKEIASSIVSFRRKNIHFTVSLGLAMYPKDGVDIQSILNIADKFLYQAKREGKNKLCFSQ